MSINLPEKRLSANLKTGNSHLVALWSFGIFLFTLIQDLVNWPILQFARVVSPVKYRDTYWVLVDADCFGTIGSGIYGLQTETGCPGYIYGLPLLRALDFLQIGQEDTKLFAYAMRALFVISVALVINSLKFSLQIRLMLACVLFLSPGVQLMLYNSNFDLLIFTMIIFGYFAIQQGRVNSGLFLIFASGLFKFYTIPLLLLFAILLPRNRNKISSIILFLVASSSAFMDLRRMQEQIPSTGYAQFGLTIFAKYLEEVGFSLSSSAVYLVSFGFFFLMAFLINLLLKSKGIFDGFEIAARNHLYLILSAVFISCFLTGISYDPRLIYLTLASFILVSITVRRTPRVLIWVGILASSLLSCGIELGLISKNQTGFHPIRSIQLINDLAIEFLSVLISLNLLYWFLRLLRDRCIRN